MESAQHFESFSNDRNALCQLGLELRQRLQTEQAERARSAVLLTAAQEALEKLAAENAHMSEHLMWQHSTDAQSSSPKPPGTAADVLWDAHQRESQRYRQLADERTQECERLRKFVREQTAQANSTIMDMARRNLELEDQLRSLHFTVPSRGRAHCRGSSTPTLCTDTARQATHASGTSVPRMVGGALASTAASRGKSVYVAPLGSSASQGSLQRSRRASPVRRSPSNGPHRTASVPRTAERRRLPVGLAASRDVDSSLADPAVPSTSSRAGPSASASSAASSTASVTPLAPSVAHREGLRTPPSGLRSFARVYEDHGLRGNSVGSTTLSAANTSVDAGCLRHSWPKSPHAGVARSAPARPRSNIRAPRGPRKSDLEQSLDVMSAELRRMQQESIAAAQ